MARSTRSRIATLTGDDPLTTFDTVLGDTSASRATSLTVARTWRTLSVPASERESLFPVQEAGVTVRSRIAALALAALLGLSGCGAGPQPGPAAGSPAKGGFTNPVYDSNFPDPM